jgi:hypothetical protein
VDPQGCLQLLFGVAAAGLVAAVAIVGLIA